MKKLALLEKIGSLGKSAKKETQEYSVETRTQKSPTKNTMEL